MQDLVIPLDPEFIEKMEDSLCQRFEDMGFPPLITNFEICWQNENLNNTATNSAWKPTISFNIVQSLPIFNFTLAKVVFFCFCSLLFCWHRKGIELDYLIILQS